MISVIFYIITFVLVIYLCFVIWMTWNWYNNDCPKEFSKSEIVYKVSVVVPFRNEQKNLQKCIGSLVNQSYSSDNYNVFLVNDHSDDGSVEIALKAQESIDSIKYLSLKDLYGKKGGITLAIEHSTAEIIVVIDADVIVEKEWLQTIVSYYNYAKFDYLALPVLMEKRSSFFQNLQQLEFISLIASAASCLFAGKALMSNGANHAFRRDSFEKLGGYKGNEHIASGDDLFLMFKMEDKLKGNVRYLMDKRVIATTKPAESFGQFLKQRVRWASKAKHYTSTFAIVISWLILLVNISFVFVLFYSLIYKTGFDYFFVISALKMIVDLLFIIGPLSFFDKSSLRFYTIPLVLLYPWYILVVGIASFFYRPKWKGRDIIIKPVS